jgi:hypothetical protein
VEKIPLRKQQLYVNVCGYMRVVLDRTIGREKVSEWETDSPFENFGVEDVWLEEGGMVAEGAVRDGMGSSVAGDGASIVFEGGKGFGGKGQRGEGG